MEKLYYQLPYVKQFEAKVLSCEKGKKGFEVILDRTGFYPEGGGQPSDTGMLGEARVLEVHEKGEEIIHYTDREMQTGQTVAGTIDWEGRFSNMQQHSGEHIVSGLIHGRYGYDNVGFHMGHEEMTIDLNGSLTWTQLMEIEKEANEVVYSNQYIAVTYPAEEELAELDYRSKKELTGQVRIVEIPGSDCCACCGTHVERTGEIGAIKFLSMIHYKGGVRISMICGAKAMEDYDRKTDQAIAISNLLSAKPDRLAEAVERLKNEAAEKDARIGALTRELFTLKAERYEEGQKLLLVFEEGLLPVQVRQFCNLLLEEGKAGTAAVFSPDGRGGYNYCAGSRAIDMKEAGKTLNAKLNGRGGGSSQMIQGSFAAPEEEIKEVFEAFL
ncbi:alanyl-tRNA editing protein [Clostridium transplantifaecale]|uniref:alanyl-tRNA editing protein n=1 Tax=Clostridium transplantifaecale TaxID=2479838 RepID=UPI000F630193|nr:alanine--tRNA ligase-related protein [Clostridium transplantifaecale]